MTELSELIGKTLTSIKGCEAGSEEVELCFHDFSRYRLFHSQDCCESVWLEDVVGDPADLVGEVLVVCEESESEEKINGKPNAAPDEFLWTFYRFASRKGWVVLRWLGESNGYYSMGVSLEETTTEEDKAQAMSTHMAETLPEPVAPKARSRL